ncbi:hypothetical protein J6590_011395 [Homalodisca vitripennis]|nr:hypothetical protein J6590_011395 [Homalodisca vitripennis]
MSRAYHRFRWKVLRNRLGVTGAQEELKGLSIIRTDSFGLFIYRANRRKGSDAEGGHCGVLTGRLVIRDFFLLRSTGMEYVDRRLRLAGAVPFERPFELKGILYASHSVLGKWAYAPLQTNASNPTKCPHNKSPLSAKPDSFWKFLDPRFTPAFDPAAETPSLFTS